MRGKIENYMQGCLVCQREETEQNLPREKLEPLPILSRP